MADNSAGVAAVSTHSRLKAAGKIRGRLAGLRLVSTHSRLKAAVAKRRNRFQTGQFQHTAA